MKSGRPKSAICKFKAWPQKRSQNLSCNQAQTLLRIVPIARVLERKNNIKSGGWKDKTISNNFHADHLLKF